MTSLALPRAALLAAAALALSACGEDTGTPTLDITVPASVAAPAGGSVTVPITLERHGRSSAVSLSLVAPPAGVSAVTVVTSEATTGLLVEVAAAVPPGAYLVNLLAFESEELFAQIPFTLVVTAAP
jgi:hypothetical protein